MLCTLLYASHIGDSIAVTIAGDLHVFLAVGKRMEGNHVNIRHGFHLSVGATAIERQTPTSDCDSSPLVNSCPRVRLLEELVDLSAVLSFLGTKMDTLGTGTLFNTPPALFLGGIGGAGKTYIIREAILQLRGTGITVTSCDAELAIDEASLGGGGGRIIHCGVRQKVDDIQRIPSPSLHGAMLAAAETNGMVIIENFGCVMRALRHGNLQGKLHGVAQRSGAALQVSNQINCFERRVSHRKLAGVIIVSDEPLEEAVVSPNSKQRAACPYCLVSRYESILRVPIADHTFRTTICTTQLAGIPLMTGLTSQILSSGLARWPMGHISGYIATIIDAAILVAAVRAHEDMSISLCWSDMCNATSITPYRLVDRQGIETGIRDTHHAVLGRTGMLRPTWNGIGGCESAKREVERALIWPQEHATRFERFKIASPCGIVLHGPPGNGKTLLARSVALKVEAKFVQVSSTDLLRPFLGESEAIIRRLFVTAREIAPCVLYLDEIDAIGGTRVNASCANGSTIHARLVATLLSELDDARGNNKGVASGSVGNSSKRHDPLSKIMRS